MKHTVARRSECPINFTLELLGDPWSLLVVRDIVYFGKRTFGEFLSSTEGMARNILSARLTRLQERGILQSAVHPTDGRKEVYTLTETGVGLVPLLLAAADWGAEHAPSTDAPPWWIELVRERRDELTQLISEAVREGRSVFVGGDSVVAELAGRTPTRPSRESGQHTVGPE
ncbi:helix-turn-helix transcriptional regulator [Microbacterium sp. zg.B48]|nr:MULTISPECIES: helix-turn-helix domain-containing protein [unclassified Microbacterium]MCR2764922.1 helix-turn-helix transcriptional regulator [Microbacterium sp. zg.B48]MCR2808152.1 helix-turn-helix transcriptional regulator [Microbacterium sp. zg.B185]WIM19382.1 helix-turn-helix domain-containing protein [Microbacterium sp. zg-B185]